MDNYVLVLTILGLAAFGMAWMPVISKKLKISYSVIYVALGALIYALIDTLPEPNPTKENLITLRLTELVVIISLMGVGLKIDQRFSFKAWAIPLRLVSVTMLLSIVATAALAHFWLSFNMASAILLGAALAPTDPVLASDVQVGPPLEKDRSNVRFSLTAEGGLNDGMAFPFTWLAIALVMYQYSTELIGTWFIQDFIVRIVVGVVAGLLLGKGIGYLVFNLPKKTNQPTIGDGFVALSATLVVYGLTELLHGYGFIAVFICSVTIRNFEMDHKFHLKLHAFMDQIERILVAVVLILFGGSIVNGVLSIMNWHFALFGLASIFVVRPLCASLSLFNKGLQMKEKWVISFFGIKGVGSLFYLSFALNEAKFENAAAMWCIVSFIVLCSIIIHGFSAPKSMEKLENPG
jgi:sodium/hydrogen antiporter